MNPQFACPKRDNQFCAGATRYGGQCMLPVCAYNEGEEITQSQKENTLQELQRKLMEDLE